MKKIIFLVSLVFSTSIFAANLEWYDLEMYGRYFLKQDITFDNGISFKAGEQFDMLDFIAGGVPVAFFQMHQVNCQNADQTAEMILVDVPGENKNTVIGAQLEEGCNLGLYVETKDFFTESPFAE